MTYAAFVTDTHPLIWYFCAKERKLSKKVRKIFDEAIQHKTKIIYVPATVLWELSILVEADEIKLNMTFNDWIDNLFNNETLIEVPMDRHIIMQNHGLSFTDDPFDKSIVATALEMQLPLITNDALIHQMAPCKLFWD